MRLPLPFHTAGSSPGLPVGIVDAARIAWLEVLAGFDTPTLIGPPRPVGTGTSRRRLFPDTRAHHPGRHRAGPLIAQHRQHRPAERLRDRADVADRPSRRRLRHRGFGAPRGGTRRGVDDRPVDQHRAGTGDHRRRRPPLPICSTSCATPTTTPSNTSTSRSATSTAPPVTKDCLTPSSCTRTIRPTRRRCRAGRVGHQRAHQPRLLPLPASDPGRAGPRIELRRPIPRGCFRRGRHRGSVERLQRVLVTMSGDPAQPLSSINLDERSCSSSRKPVPVSASERHSNGAGYRAPATLVEQILAGIWAEVLGVDRVGVDESFFDLGGDSLSAMRAVAAINTALDVHLAVPTLLNAPSVRASVEQLASQCRPGRRAPRRQPGHQLKADSIPHVVRSTATC